MLKRLGLIITLLLFLLTLSPTLGFAQSDLAGVAAMARYFPADTVFFAATRTDEDFLSLLDTLQQPIFQSAEAAGAPSAGASLSETLNLGLANINTTLDGVMGWLGDYAAIGSTAQGFEPATVTPAQGFYAVIEIADRAGAEAFFVSVLSLSPFNFARSEEGSFTIFASDLPGGTGIAISDDLLLIYPQIGGLPQLIRDTQLDFNPDYQAAVGALPADSYNVLAYIDPTPFAQNVPLDPTGKRTLESAPLALGFTMLDDRTFAIELGAASA